MRVFSLLALLSLVLAGCLDQGPAEPNPIDGPGFYNSAGNYWLVTKLADTNDHTCDADCSLREAIEDAAAGDEIRFGVSGTITLTATLQVNKNLTITGPGAAQLKVSGNHAYGVFSFGAGVTASLSGLTVSDGLAANGGGIINRTGSLTITGCVISGNSATSAGGGIYNDPGALTIRGSIISGNSAAGGAGLAIYKSAGVTITETTVSDNIADSINGGGMYVYNSTLTLDRSTLSGNTAQGNGGGARFQLGTTTILNSTISGNTAFGGGGGGIQRFAGTTHIVLSTITDNNAAAGAGGVYTESTPEIYVKGSIIWGNTTVGTAADLGGSTYFSMGHNLIGAGGAISRFTADGDQTGVTNALLGPLQLNAPGKTATHALLAGSPAIDAGTCTDHAGVPVTSDQRGITRPQVITCDVGAYELLLPPDAVEALARRVKALGPGGTATLNKGQTNSLLVTLDVVLKKLAGGQRHVALNNLHAFIDKVETFIADGVLDTAEGQPLIAAAEQIIAAIEGM